MRPSGPCYRPSCWRNVAFDVFLDRFDWELTFRGRSIWLKGTMVNEDARLVAALLHLVLGDDVDC